MLLMYFIFPSVAQQPAYDEVAKHFIFTYNVVDNKDEIYQLQFAKKKDGWYLYKNYYLDTIEQERDFELFWSKDENRYLNLHFPKITETKKAQLDTTTEMAKYASSYGSYNIEHCLFAGYRDWDIDIIKELENKPDLSEFELESLARAYSNYAMGFMLAIFGKPSDKALTTRKELNKCELPNLERATLFADNVKKAIAAYQKLKEKNPAFQTMVGDIQTKLSGEYIYGYTYLLYCGFPELAKSFLVDNLYDAYSIEYAKRILQPLKKNAILFSYGDIDTYPLIYLQEKEGYRNDVIVLNVGQLQVSQFLNYFNNKYNNLFPASFSNYYCCKNSEYLYLSDGTESRTSKYVNSLTTKLAELSKQCDSINPSYALFTTKQFIHYDLQPSTFELPNLMYLSDVAELQLIVQNLYNRPIYYTLGTSTAIGDVFFPYMVQRDLVDEITDNAKSKLYPKNSNEYVFVNRKVNMMDTTAMRKFYTNNNFSIDTNDITYKNNYLAIIDIYGQYAANFLEYAAVLKDNNQLNTITDLYLKNKDLFFFNSQTLNIFISLAYVQFLSDIGQFAECSKAIDAIYDNIAKNKSHKDLLNKAYKEIYLTETEAIIKKNKLPNKKLLLSKLDTLRK